MLFQRLICTVAVVALAGTAIATEKFRTLWRGQWVEYVEVGDYAITEGDIIIGKKEAVREWARAVERGQQQIEASRKALAIDSPSRVWNLTETDGVVKVPYTITAGNRTNIDAAIAEVNRVLAGAVRWIPRTNETDYVDFNLDKKDFGSCSSFVGRIGGKQDIAGETDCSVGGLVHEMGHAMGLWHIQQDARASAFVDFRLANMDAGKRNNNQPIFGTRTWGGYDYESNMHYSRVAFPATSADRITLETKPPGISVGTNPTYSAADLDALFRMYGKAPTQTTIQSNPTGLKVIVDGVSHTTPAKFNWPIGSVHRVWVESGLQSTGGYRYAFGRWSHDASAEPSTQLTWEVLAGDGTLGSPTTSPTDTVIVANFVRLIDVQQTPTNDAGGTSNVVAARPPWPGTSTLYPQFTRFDLTAQPALGFLPIFSVSNVIASRGGLGSPRSNVSLLLSGSAPVQTIGVGFHTGATIAFDVVGVGLEDGVAVRVTPPGGTLSTIVAPRIARSTQGTWKFDMQSPQLVGASIRYIREAYDGFDNPDTGEVAMPAAGVRNVSIRARREVAPYKQVRPSCAGFVSLSDSSQWLRTGSPLSVNVVPNGVGVFAGWSGTLSGFNSSSNITVGSNVPEFVANFNQINEPLTFTSASPTVIGNESVTTTFEVRGGGFTPTSQVAIGNQTFNTTYVNSTMLRFTAARDALSTGRAPVFVRNALSGSCIATSSAGAIDVLAPGRNASVVLTEYYNPALDYFFLTGRASDKQLLDGIADWRRTGAEMKLNTAAVDGSFPLERFFFANVAKNGARGSHFFTSIAAEQRALTALNPTNLAERTKPFLEGIEGYAVEKKSDGSCPDRSIPVYRAFKGAPRYVDDGNHRFSTSLAQHRDMVDRLGWTDEGIVFCALP